VEKVSTLQQFGSHVWLNRSGERVDFMPGFDPFLTSMVRARCGAAMACEATVVRGSAGVHDGSECALPTA
jgi:hypothetical protein